MSSYKQVDFRDTLRDLSKPSYLTFVKALNEKSYEESYDIAIKLNSGEIPPDKLRTYSVSLYNLCRIFQYKLKNRSKAAEILKITRQISKDPVLVSLLNKKAELLNKKINALDDSDFIQGIKSNCFEVNPDAIPIDTIIALRPEIFEKAKAPLAIQYVDSILSIGIYRWKGDGRASEALSMMLRLFKGGEEHTVDFMKYLTVEYLKQNTHFLEDIDIIVPVPAEPNRVQKRGFDLALEIATAISLTQAIPLEQPLYRKIDGISAKHSSSLELKEQYNIDKDKKILNRLGGLRALVVDDIITSGKTISACIDLLRTIGVSGFKAFSLARSESSIKSSQYR